MRRIHAASLIAVVLVLLGVEARGELFLVQEGQDSSPYAFLPELPRGFRNSAYAFRNDLDGEDHSFEYFIRFELPPALTAPGTVVQNAYAFVYYGFDFILFGDSTSEVGEILCHEVLEPWSESTLTWNNRPAIGTWFEVVPDIVDFGPYSCDVTNLVQRWIDDPDSNHGIALTSEQLRVIGFHTYDDGVVSSNFMPSLVVNTLPEPGVAAGFLSGAGAIAALSRRRARRRSGAKPRR